MAKRTKARVVKTQATDKRANILVELHQHIDIPRFRDGAKTPCGFTAYDAGKHFFPRNIALHLIEKGMATELPDEA